MANMRMERELKETEDVALYALKAYEQADKQRTELYYQAKNSNSGERQLPALRSQNDSSGERSYLAPPPY